MSKHTTLPLEVVGNLVRTTLPNGGMLIADCRDADGQPFSEEAKANALLFSAAHELLEALIDLVGWQTCAPDETVAKAHTAISRATGEQQ